MIRSNVIDFLSSRVDNKSSTIAFYYCAFSDIVTLQTVSILGTILKQLLLPKSSLLDTLNSALSSTFENVSRSPDRKELTKLLGSVLEAYSQVYVIIDGLDECEKNVQQDVLYAINEIVQIPEHTVKVWVSNREDAEIKNTLKAYSCLYISEANVTGDIANYVEASVKSRLSDGDLLIRDPGLENEIISTLTAKSQGMCVLCKPPKSRFMLILLGFFGYPSSLRRCVMLLNLMPLLENLSKNCQAALLKHTHGLWKGWRRDGESFFPLPKRSSNGSSAQDDPYL